MKKCAVAALVLALYGGCGAAGAQAAASGAVLALSGSATIESGGQQRALAMGDPVQAGDTIEVAQDSKVRLRMEDGSVLTIAPGSKMTIDAYDVDGTGHRQNAELTMASGLLRAVVSAGSGTPNFEVKTATGVASVRGTDWYIDAEGDTTQVYVVTGNVALADSDGQNAVTIPQMSASSVASRKPPVAPKPVPATQLWALEQRTAFNLGLCQCIGVHNEVTANCRATTDACQAFCSGGRYSFVPYAPASCGLP